MHCTQLVAKLAEKYKDFNKFQTLHSLVRKNFKNFKSKAEFLAAGKIFISNETINRNGHLISAIIFSCFDKN
jgi:hypothetical protein